MATVARDQIRAAITDGYPRAAVFDELIGPDGKLKPHWAGVIAGLEALTHDERLARIDRINARVRETGIAHDLFADPTQSLQHWRLDLMPLVFTEAMWSEIEAAVIQRARLNEAILADLYGPQSLMRRGLVPPELVFSDTNFLRACHGLEPKGGRIQFFATDLARDKEGRWRIVDTHVETPAGIGYALANRTVLTHVSGDIFSASRAMRLAPYFQQMQDSLARRVNRPAASIALLTPGPRHDDFFSHAYLARYLGLLLVEGDDLRVDDGRIYSKTLDGLHPIDLVVRCTAGAHCDPLELDPSGFLGPVGLVQAVRCEPDVVVNALGTAIAENRGLGGYLPRLCQELLGEEIKVWDVDKLWLGDAAVRHTVLADLERYFIRSTSEQTARPGQALKPRDPALMSQAERAALINDIELNGATLVAEEKMELGTTPSYGAAGLEPRSYALRVFATAVPGGFAVMPGGLAMTVDPGASMALTAPDGASRDVWVLSETELPPFRSLWRPTIEAAQIQRKPRVLPSRAADNLFWLGRYTERADWTLRVLRNSIARIEEDSGPRQSLDLARAVLVNLLERDGGAPVAAASGPVSPRQIADLAALLAASADRSYGLIRTLDHIHRVASLTRDRLSLEAWRTLNAFHMGRRWQKGQWPTSIGEALDQIDAGLAVIAAFNGLTHENMTRNFGWRLLDMGRRLSRALNVSQFLLLAFQSRGAEEDESSRLMFVLELADSLITYRSRYRLAPMLPLILDLLVMDETNPRSLAFQLAALSQHIDALPQTGQGRGRTEVQRQALALVSDVRLASIEELIEVDEDGHRPALAALLGGLVTRIPQLSDAITRRYFSVTEKETRWARARSLILP